MDREDDADVDEGMRTIQYAGSLVYITIGVIGLAASGWSPDPIGLLFGFHYGYLLLFALDHELLIVDGPNGSIRAFAALFVMLFIGIIPLTVVVPGATLLSAALTMGFGSLLGWRLRYR